MTLHSALHNAISGLRYASNASNVIANNVSNAESKGYVRRTIQTEEVRSYGSAHGVSSGEIKRYLDHFLQTQMRMETGVGSFLKTHSSYLSLLDLAFGQPGSAASLETGIVNLISASQKLIVNPENIRLRSDFLRQSQDFITSLHNISGTIQALRNKTESEMRQTVEDLNDLIQKFKIVDKKIVQTAEDNSSRLSLLDQREAYLKDISCYITITKIDKKETGSWSL